MRTALQLDEVCSIDNSENVDDSSLEFLWLELTNRCNLECVHCYADSSPRGSDGTLSARQYAGLLSEAYEVGCRRVQFIGGEPTLNRSLPFLIAQARGIGFEVIEVYTNLLAVSDDLLDCFEQYRVNLATSVYSDHAEIHDAVTARPGSWARTSSNVKRVVARGIPIRASIIEMDLNQGASSATSEWLQSIGVSDVGTDRLRHFGRGSSGHDCQMSELCGSCASRTLCVSPEGMVSPCIMSKSWPVGCLSTDTLTSIVSSSRLRNIRKAIHDATSDVREFEMGGCQPDSRNPCNPDCAPHCGPCTPNRGDCPPTSCRPKVTRRA